MLFLMLRPDDYIVRTAGKIVLWSLRFLLLSVEYHMFVCKKREVHSVKSMFGAEFLPELMLRARCQPHLFLHWNQNFVTSIYPFYLVVTYKQEN